MFLRVLCTSVVQMLCVILYGMNYSMYSYGYIIIYQLYHVMYGVRFVTALRVIV